MQCLGGTPVALGGAMKRGGMDVRFRLWRLAAAFALVFSAGLAGTAHGAEGRTRYLRNIVLEDGGSRSDVVCYACSIRIRGNVKGDIIAIGGSVEVEGTLSGDVAAIGGSVRLGPGAKVSGDVAAIGGTVVRDPQATASRDVDSVPWFFWPGQRELQWRGVLALLGFHFGLLFVFYLAAGRRRVLKMAVALEQRPRWTLLAGVAAVGFLYLLYELTDWASSKVSALADYDQALFWCVTAIGMVILGFGYAGLACRLGRAMRLRSGALAGLIGDAPLPATLAGILVIPLLELIPVVGTLAFVVLALLASGAAVASVFGLFPREAGRVPTN